MGRKKIAIKPIQSAASRRATFEKRRIGLLKKAMELSILCECTISVSIERKIEKDLQIYASEPFDEIIAKYQQFDGTYRLLTNDHIDEMIPGKMSSNHVGYQVRKRAESVTVDASASDKHYTFQNEQLNPTKMISQMEIIPSVPSPNLNNLYSQLLPSPHPSFNGYQPTRYNQSHFQFASNDIPPPPPTFNHINTHKRSFTVMNDMTGFAEPMPKRFKIENTNKKNNTLNTSETTTVEIPAISNSFSPEMSPPIVHPLELQINDEINAVKFE